jgi:hypothetical protein
LPSTSQNSSGDAATQAAEQVGRDAAGDAVAAVDDDFHRPCQLDVADDAVKIGLAHAGVADMAAALAKVGAGDTAPQVLDHVAVTASGRPAPS